MRANRGCSAFEVCLGARSGRVGIDFVWQAILFGCVQPPCEILCTCSRRSDGATLFASRRCFNSVGEG